MKKISKKIILEETFNIILNEGIEKVTISNLANKLNCSKSSLYYYVDSKDELFLEIVKMVRVKLDYELDFSNSLESNLKIIINHVFENFDTFVFFKIFVQSGYLSKDDKEFKYIINARQKSKEKVKKLYDEYEIDMSFEVFTSMLFGPLFFNIHRDKKSRKMSYELKGELTDQIIKTIVKK